MSTIGLINIVAKANSNSLVKETDKAKKSLGELKSEAASSGSSFSSFSAGFTKAAGAIGAAATAIGVAALASSLKTFVEESGQSIVATTRLADRLGVTTEEMVGLQYAGQTLGTEQVEAFGDALSDMQEKIGDITTEEGGAKDIVKILGLDASKLAAQDAATNFKQIADAMKNVKSAAERAHIADTLFGGVGQKLVPLLDQGSEGIEALSAEAENLGLKFSRVDAAKVELANAAIGRMSAVIEGVGQQLAIGLAPYIEATANAFTDLGVQGIDVAGYITSAMELIGTGVGIVLDVVHTLGLGWDAMGATASSVVAGVIGVLADMADGVEYVINQIPGVEVEFGSMLRDMADDAAKFADDDWQKVNEALAAPPPSEGIKQFFDDIRDGADTIASEIAEAKKPLDELGQSFTGVALKVSELTDRLKEQIATYGKSSAEVEIYKLKSIGATDEQIEGVKKLANELKAKEVIQNNLTPLEKYKQEVGELQELLKGGFIDQATFNRAKGKAAKDSGLNEVKFASATELGSNEARQAVLRHQGIGSKDPTLGVEKNTATLVSSANKQNTYLATIAKAVSADDTFSFN